MIIVRRLKNPTTHNKYSLEYIIVSGNIRDQKRWLGRLRSINGVVHGNIHLISLSVLKTVPDTSYIHIVEERIETTST